MDRPVRGSAVLGASGARSLGRSLDTAASFRWAVLARLSSSSTLRRPSLTAIGASEVESTPPPMPDSSCPSLILLASEPIASMPVAQAICTS